MLKKIPKVRGFKMNKKTGHVSLAYKQKKETVYSIGFSHKKNKKSGKMSKIKSIDPSKPDDPCFVKHKVEKYKYNNYRTKSEYKRYRIHQDDKNLIQKIKKSG